VGVWGNGGDLGFQSPSFSPFCQFIVVVHLTQSLRTMFINPQHEIGGRNLGLGGSCVEMLFRRTGVQINAIYAFVLLVSNIVLIRLF